MKDKTYILLIDGVGGHRFEPVKGKPVEIMDGIDAFIYSDDGIWVVTDARTGTDLGKGMEQADAIKQAKEGIEENGMEEYRIRQQRAIERYGETPAAREKKERHGAWCDRYGGS